MVYTSGGKKNTTTVGGGTTTISAVHSDVIQTHILTCLDGPALASVASTCSQLNALSAHEHLWANISHSTWPSTNTPRIRHVISTFPNASRSFFSDSFPTPIPTTHNFHHRTPELISAVDLFHRERVIVSKVVETETESGWFLCSPFRVDLLDPKDSIETSMEYPRNEKDVEDLVEEIKLSWIVIDPRGKRAMNVSSGKPVTVQRHWLTGEVQVRFATVLGGGEKGSATEVTLCNLMVTLGREMQVRETCLQIEDMDGILLKGRDSLGILQRALEGGRKRMRDEKEGRERYMEFVNRKMEWKEKKVKTERMLDTLCVVLAVLSFAAFSTILLF